MGGGSLPLAFLLPYRGFSPFPLLAIFQKCLDAFNFFQRSANLNALCQFEVFRVSVFDQFFSQLVMYANQRGDFLAFYISNDCLRSLFNNHLFYPYSLFVSSLDLVKSFDRIVKCALQSRGSIRHRNNSSFSIQW